MDNLCHTLVGAACAEAGLKRRTRFASATLMIAANLPDVDVLVFATDVPAVAFRRGWTHGILAQALLPVVLTLAVVALGRRRPPPADGPPMRAGWVLGLAYLGILSHVFLDFLNNYGIRLLAPFDWRWFYGDAVFIVDPWLWLSLGAGVWLSRRQGRTRPAQGALVFAACYVALMLVSARAARVVVAEAWRTTRGAPAVALDTAQALMVGPVPISPFTRTVVVEAGDRYELGTFSWRSREVTFEPGGVPKNDGAPEVVAARRDPRIQGVLVWARFPAWQLTRRPGGTDVRLGDVRFGGPGPRLGASTIVPDAP